MILNMRWVNNCPQYRLNIYCNCRDLTSTSFFNIFPSLYDAPVSSSCSLIYALKIIKFWDETSHVYTVSFCCYSGSSLMLNTFATIFEHFNLLVDTPLLFSLSADILLYSSALGSPSAHTKYSLFVAVLSLKWKAGCPSLWYETHYGNARSWSDCENG